MALRDLLVKLGIQVEGKQQLEQTNAALGQAIKKSNELGRSLQRIGRYFVVRSLFNGIRNLIVNQFKATDALKHNAERLGLTTNELQKYEYAAQQAQVPTEQVAIAMRFFNRAVGEAALGTKSAQKTFVGLGINIRDAGGKVRPTNELLFEFADKLKAIPSQAERTAYVMRTLGRNGSAMLPILQQGGKALQQTFKDVDELGGGFNDKFVEQAHETDIQLKRLRMAYRSIYVAIATEVLPYVRKWVDHSIKNAKSLIELAKKTYAFRTALVALTSGGVVYGLIRLFKLFAPAKMSVTGLLQAFLKNAGLLLFVGLLTAAYLILDDFYTFLQGGDSVLGRFLDQIGGKGTALKFWHDLHDAWVQVKEAITPATDSLKEFGKQSLLAFIDSVPSIIKWGGTIITWVVKVLDEAVAGLRILGVQMKGIVKAGGDYLTGDFNAGDKAMDDALKQTNDIVDSTNNRVAAYDKMIDAFQKIGDPNYRGKVPDQGMPIDAKGGIGLPPPPAPGTQRPIHVSVTNNIHGAHDPHATGRAVGAATKAAVKDALAQHRDTFAAVNAGMPDPGY